MKKILSLVAAGCLALALLQCTDDGDAALPSEDVQFSFSIASGNDDGRTAAVTLPEGTTLVVSVETTSGDPVLTRQEIQLLKMGDAYVSEPFAFTPGRYVVTEFILTDGGSEILYATPLKGSPLSKAVIRPLPFTFQVSRNKLSTIAMEVVSASFHTPEDFGYTSFSIGVVSPFQVTVFKPHGDNLVLTSAELFILKDMDTLQTFALGAKVNLFPFQQDPEEEYTLVVIKDGYSRYAKEFSYVELEQELNGQPLQITLQPALTMVGITAGSNNHFAFQLDAILGIFDYTIDWGDGSTEVWTSGVQTYIEHDYAAPGQYFVSVTGALQSIGLTGSFSMGGMKSLDMRHLTNMWEFRYEYPVQAPKVLDLSHSNNIFMIYILNTNVENIILPNDVEIAGIDMAANTNLTVQSMDALIDSLHHQAVSTHRTRYGFLWISKTLSSQDEMMVTPSPAAMVKLRDLQNYGWEVVPDPDLFP